MYSPVLERVVGEEVVSGNAGSGGSRIKTGRNYGRAFGFSLWSNNNGEGKALKATSATSSPVAEVLTVAKTAGLVTDDFEKSLLSTESDCSTVIMSPAVDEDEDEESFAATSVALSLTETIGYDYCNKQARPGNDASGLCLFVYRLNM